jgi:hypothetical protein
MRRVSMLVAALALASQAIAATLVSETEVPGFKRVCVYSDGTTLTIHSANLCPLTK